MDFSRHLLGHTWSTCWVQSSCYHMYIYIYWLVVWTIFLWLSISWECHHPHHPIWRTHMFQRGRLNHQPVIIHPSGKSTMFIGGINLPFPVMGGKNGIVFPTWNGTLGNIIQLLGYPHDLLWMGAKSCTMAMTQEPIHWKYLPYIRPFLRPIWY